MKNMSNNIQLLKAQCNLALMMIDKIDKRARPGIDNYIQALEERNKYLQGELQKFEDEVLKKILGLYPEDTEEKIKLV